jgi:hypothetical protein
MHRYVGGRESTEPFHWSYANDYPLLKAWCARHVSDRKLVSDLAVAEIAERGILARRVAEACVAELLSP